MAEGSQASGNSPGNSADKTLADQSSIDDLLKQAQFEDPTPDGSDPAPSGSTATATAIHDAHAAASTGHTDHHEESPARGAAADLQQFDLPSLDVSGVDIPPASLDLLKDVELNVKIELGRSRMLVEDVLKLAEGSVVELDKLAGDPVDVFVNDRLVARGEVLVLNDNFCVRVNEIVAAVKEEGM